MKQKSATKRRKASVAEEKELSVKVQPFGPSPEEIDSLKQTVMKHPTVQKYLTKTRNRLLRIDLIDPDEEIKASRPKLPSQFEAMFFDYTNNRTILAKGDLPRAKKFEITELRVQPRPTAEEFEEALNIVMADPELSSALHGKRLRTYRPMPPLVREELPDGLVERTVAVGLMPQNGDHRHEIVGVNLPKRKVIRFEPSERGRAPAMSAAHNPICGLPDASQSTASGTPGSAWVTVTQGNTTLWKFLVVRPAASSGTNGSGVELRFVDYRGKRLLYRAHVPILNVKYERDACGPYRDWQDQEGMIQADGIDVAPGFRLCPTPAQTILDSGSDNGNYLGVAIYVQGQEVVLVSEMEAGWYRYISLWRLHANGTIRPRFGFSAVQSSCVCTVHHHHVYWRFDFDMRTAGNNAVREFNDPPLAGSSNWHTKTYEIRRPRNPSRKRKWRVMNKSTKEAYDIVPGPNDGIATASADWPFARGDVWILRYRPSEIDDGVIATGPPYEAGLDAWVNGRAINGDDVVIWYGAHFTHDLTHEEPGELGHVVGPDLNLVKW